MLGAGLLALTVGVMAGRAGKAPRLEAEEMRDAVAAPPINPAMLGAARVIRPEAGWFATPATRRADAERALLSSRAENLSKALRARSAKLRAEAARARAAAAAASAAPVPAQ